VGTQDAEIVEDAEDSLQDIQRQALLDMHRFVGYCEGNYRDQEGIEKSPLQDGVNINIYGTGTVEVEVDGEEPSPFSEIQLWLPPVRRPNRGLQGEQKINRITPTVKEFNPKCVADQMRVCVTRYLKALEMTANGKAKTNSSFFAMDDSAKTQDFIYHEDYRLGHLYTAGILGACIRFVELLQEKGVLQGDARMTVAQLEDWFGLVYNVVPKAEAVEVLKKLLVPKRKEMTNLGKDLYKTLSINTLAHTADSVAEVVSTKNRYIGRMLQSRTTTSANYTGGIRRLDLFLHC
jgi:hypothetical protein